MSDRKQRMTLIEPVGSPEVKPGEKPEGGYPSENLVFYKFAKSEFNPDILQVAPCLAGLGIKYKCYGMEFKEASADWFRHMSPLGSVPVVEDRLDDGKEIVLNTPGSILQYLVTRYDTDFKVSYKPLTAEWVEMIKWVNFADRYLSPSMEELKFWENYSMKQVPEALQHVKRHVKHSLAMLDEQLDNNGASDFLVGNKETIADYACFGFAAFGKYAKIDLKTEYPAVYEWAKRIFDNHESGWGKFHRQHEYAVDTSFSSFLHYDHNDVKNIENLKQNREDNQARANYIDVYLSKREQKLFGKTD